MVEARALAAEIWPSIRSAVSSRVPWWRWMSWPTVLVVKVWVVSVAVVEVAVVVGPTTTSTHPGTQCVRVGSGGHRSASAKAKRTPKSPSNCSAKYASISQRKSNENPEENPEESVELPSPHRQRL